MGKKPFDKLTKADLQYDRSVAYEQIFGYNRIVDGTAFIGDRESAMEALSWLDRKGFIVLTQKYDSIKKKRVPFYDISGHPPVY